LWIAKRFSNKLEDNNSLWSRQRFYPSGGAFLPQEFYTPLNLIDNKEGATFIWPPPTSSPASDRFKTVHYVGTRFECCHKGCVHRCKATGKYRIFCNSSSLKPLRINEVLRRLGQYDTHCDVDIRWLAKNNDTALTVLAHLHRCVFSLRVFYR